MDEILRQLWDFTDPVASEARFRNAARDHVRPELALTQVARALGLQRRFDDAEGLLAGLEQADPEVVVRVELERGRIARDTDRAAAAREHFRSAIRRARDAGLEEPLIDGLHMLALVSDGLAREDLHEQALAVARTATDPAARRWEASILNNIGMDVAGAGDFAAALTRFEGALQLCSADGSDLQRVGVARWMVAWAMRNLGRTTEALQRQYELRSDLRAAGITAPDVDDEIAILERDTSRGYPVTGSRPLG